MKDKELVSRLLDDVEILIKNEGSPWGANTLLDRIQALVKKIKFDE